MAGALLNARPMSFWEIGDDPGNAAMVPDWVLGWTVWDGNTYYYYFSADGVVNYIKTIRTQKWVPPKTMGNQGKVTMVSRSSGSAGPKPGYRTTRRTRMWAWVPGPWTISTPSCMSASPRVVPRSPASRERTAYIASACNPRRLMRMRSKASGC
jgi:hypothetical protein